MAISSSSTSSNNAASFSGKSAPKADKPQFGGEVFSHEAQNLSGNFIDSFAKIFTGKKNILDPKDNKTIIGQEDLYSTGEKAGIFSLLAGLPGLSALGALSSKGIYNGFGKLWNKLFKSAPKSFEHAKTQRY